MSETDGASVMGLASEVFKACIEANKDKDEKTAKTQARGGPLVTLGRAYLTLVFIMAICASTSALVDWKTQAAHSWAIEVMRYGVFAFAAVGMVGAIWLVWKLFKIDPLLLSSPSEMGATLQAQMAPKTPTEKDVNTGKSNPVQTTTNAIQSKAPSPAQTTTPVGEKEVTPPKEAK